MTSYLGIPTAHCTQQCVGNGHFSFHRGGKRTVDPDHTPTDLYNIHFFTKRKPVYTGPIGSHVTLTPSQRTTLLPKSDSNAKISNHAKNHKSLMESR